MGLYYNRKEVGKLLAEYRASVGLSQQDVASYFGYSSPQHISNIETGKSPASLEAFRGFTELYRIDKQIIAKLLIEGLKMRICEILNIKESEL
ncbi:MAG: helix-turn-helix domain-containing protein [Bdellovibrionaceae bacterium]|nr:helix-turn-helix domain-containing protein [Pseudobdellovibrionaceae bacterium]